MSEFDRIVGNLEAWWDEREVWQKVLIGMGTLALIGVVWGLV